MPQVLKKLVSKPTELRANEKKWGVPLVEAGWTMIPSTILECQAALGLDPVDLNILLQIAKHWWQEEKLPYPSIKSIANCIGKSPSTVQRRITKMKKSKVIEVKHRFNERNKGQTSSVYRFTGLIKKATEFAREIIKDREETRLRKKAFAERNKLRSKRRLRLAAGTEPADE